MIVGITGHQRLADETAWGWVEEALGSALAEIARPLIGISSLAVGADQRFAELVLEQQGELRVVLPFPTYAETFRTAEDRARYQALLEKASSVETLPRLGSEEESYYAAGQAVVDASDRLFAVWDGKPAAGLGGTGDVVRYARGLGKDVLHLDPLRRRVGPAGATPGRP